MPVRYVYICARRCAGMQESVGLHPGFPLMHFPLRPPSLCTCTLYFTKSRHSHCSKYWTGRSQTRKTRDLNLVVVRFTVQVTELPLWQRLRKVRHNALYEAWPDRGHASNVSTRWFKYDRDYFIVKKSEFVPVIFEPPCIFKSVCGYLLVWFFSPYSVTLGSTQPLIEMSSREFPSG